MDLPGTGVEFRPVGTNLEVVVGGMPITVYRTDEPTKPYYYPLIGPTGAKLLPLTVVKPQLASGAAT